MIAQITQPISPKGIEVDTLEGRCRERGGRCKVGGKRDTEQKDAQLM